MGNFEIKTKNSRLAERLPLDITEKDTYLAVVTEAEETTGSKSGKPYFKLGMTLFNEDGTPAQKRDGSGEGVTISLSTYESWPNWEGVLASFFPAIAENGGNLDLPGDFYEHWALVKLKIEQDDVKYPPKLGFESLEPVPEQYLDVINAVSMEMNGKESPTVAAIRGAKPAPKPAPKPAAPAGKPAAPAAAKPAAGAKPAAPAAKPASTAAAKPGAAGAKPAPKPAATKAGATATVDADEPFAE